MSLSTLIVPLAKASSPSGTAAYTSSAVNVAPSGGWAAGPQAVACWSTTAGTWEVGNSVTATATSFAVPASTLVNIKVPPGVTDGWVVSFFPITATGNAYATPINRG